MNFRKPTIRSLLASQWLHDHLLKGAYSSPAMPIQTSYARASYASVVSFRIGHHTDGCSYVAMGKSQCKGDSPTHQHLAFVLHVRAAETLDDHRQDQWFPLKDGYPQPQQTHTFHPNIEFSEHAYSKMVSEPVRLCILRNFLRCSLFMINSWSISRCSGCPGGIPALNGRSSGIPVGFSVSEACDVEGHHHHLTVYQGLSQFLRMESKEKIQP